MGVASALFVLTGCGPDDTGAADDAPSATTQAPGKAATPAAASATASPPSDCPTLAPGHRYIWVNNVEGAMNNVIAKDAKAECDPQMNEGAAYHPVGALKTFAFSPTAKVTVIAKNGPEVRGEIPGTKTGIAHVKTCADPEGKTYDGSQSQRGDEFCAGQNFYDVALHGDTITEMTELYGS